MSQPAVASTSSSNRSGRSTGGVVMRIVLPLLIVLSLCGMTWLWIVTFGSVAGEEFSPERFQRRRFGYYQIPMVGIQVTPVVREVFRHDVEKFLVNKKHVQVTATAQQARWDLLNDTYHDLQGPDCDAAILSYYLGKKLADGSWFWVTWTKKHPGQAKVFWPAVAELAQEQMYIFLPELLEVARDHADSADFKKRLGESVADSYCVLARARQKNDRHQQAIKLFGRALKHDAEHVDSLRGRAESLRSEGENEKAAADLAEANRIEREN